MKWDLSQIDIGDIRVVQLIAAAFISIVLIVDLFLFVSLFHNIGQARIERDKSKSSVVFFKDLISRKDQLTKVQIISQDNIDNLLSEIQEMADKNNVRVKIGSSLETDPQDDRRMSYARKDFSLEASGSYKDLGIFLTTLRNIPDAVLDINSMHLSAIKSEAAGLNAKINFVVLSLRDDED